MKNLIYPIVLTLLAMVCDILPTYAAFPAHIEPAVSVKTEKRSFEEFINSAIEKYRLPVPPVSDAVSDGGGVFNMISFVLGLSGLVAIIVLASLLFTPGVATIVGDILIASAITFGICAIIAGVRGKTQSRRRRLGVAGFILGIVDLSILVLALVAIIAWLVVYLVH